MRASASAESAAARSSAVATARHSAYSTRSRSTAPSRPYGRAAAPPYGAPPDGAPPDGAPPDGAPRAETTAAPAVTAAAPSASSMRRSSAAAAAAPPPPPPPPPPGSARAERAERAERADSADGCGHSSGSLAPPRQINAIVLDGCKKCQIVFADVVSGVELVDCDACKVQVTGTVHTISIDKSQGIQVILNEQSLGAEVLTAKCSELNVIVPGSEFESGEYKEFALPEQFISKWNAEKKTYETVCMAHAG